MKGPHSPADFGIQECRHKTLQPEGKASSKLGRTLSGHRRGSRWNLSTSYSRRGLTT
ncbi:hypothetical protein B296_00010671 [Ensete ventricosum]|uniref:Uncharacterized protein n=1 Tax=Ensete ventricosum TaxID=4639 RepID=A0A426ZYY1_ENSVE|nr:hypothetical protein B296_00010671 [Ensete ventricosum]